MSKFELTVEDSFWTDTSRWPREFYDMCEQLSQVVRRSEKRRPFETILLPDPQAELFEQVFSRLPDVVSLRRLA